MNFKDRLQNFMKGRYGPDDLYYFLFKLYLIIFILNLFINSNILSFIEIIIIIIELYRFLSKKIYIRSSENQIFLKMKKKILKPFRNIKRNYKDRNEWIYKKCKHCKKLLKLPIPEKRGTKTIRCPKCKKESNIFTFRQQKVELIKKKK